jgi:hypothetical protein
MHLVSSEFDDQDFIHLSRKNTIERLKSGLFVKNLIIFVHFIDKLEHLIGIVINFFLHLRTKV